MKQFESANLFLVKVFVLDGIKGFSILYELLYKESLVIGILYPQITAKTG